MEEPPRVFAYSRLENPAMQTRVLELQPGRHEDPIHCNIVTISLSESKTENTAYEALSYTWGTEEATCTLVLDGGTFATRPNLDSALRRLRKADAPRRLWVDAVCINQEDVDERNAQVRSMLHIYQAASRVLVWLGEENSHSGLAMARSGFMHNFHAIDHEMWDAELSPSSPRWLAFADLVARPWWKRTWVVQEVVVAGEVSVLCGSHEIEWNRLAYNLAQLTQTMHLLRDKAPISLSDETSAIALFRLRRQRERPVGLLETLHKFRSWQATDPRDKVYGLLGLAPAGQGEGVSVDYNLGVNNVYENVARSSIQAGSFKVMGLANPSSRREGLASWAPDWCTDLPFYPLRPSTLFSPSHDGAIFRPCGEASEQQFRFTESGKHLVVQAEMLGEIFLGDVNWPPFRGSKEGLQGMEGMFVQLMKNLNWPFYPNEEWTRAAFRRTLIADTFEDGRISPEDLERYLAWFEKPDEEPEPAATTDAEDGEITEISATEYTAMLPGLIAEFAHARNIHRNKDHEKEDEDFFRAIRTTGKGRALFVNQNGFVGLGPKGLRDGDLVCVPVGGDGVWLVRPCADSMGVYEFVGECYVHGIMDGGVAMPPDCRREIVLR